MRVLDKIKDAVFFFFSLLRFLANLEKFKYRLRVKPEFDKYVKVHSSQLFDIDKNLLPNLAALQRNYEKTFVVSLFLKSETLKRPARLKGEYVLPRSLN